MTETPDATSQPTPDTYNILEDQHWVHGGGNVRNTRLPLQAEPHSFSSQARVYSADIVASRSEERPKRLVIFWARFGGRDWTDDEVGVYVHGGFLPEDIERQRIGQPNVALFACNDQDEQDEVAYCIYFIKGRYWNQQELPGELHAAAASAEDAQTLMRSRRLWAKLRHTLHWEGHGNWSQRVAATGQMERVNARAAGRSWSDAGVFKALVEALLGDLPDEQLLSAIKPQVADFLRLYDLAWYAEQDEAFVDDELLPWLEQRGAGSPARGAEFKQLLRAARWLVAHSAEHGSAESYFTELVRTYGGDAIRAAAELGRANGEWHLPGFDIALAAEALRNLGFDLAKPDRHVCRAMAAAGRVEFRDWPDRAGHGEPRPTPPEQEATMRAVAALASSCQVQATYFDHVLRLVCRESGYHARNEELEEWS